MASRCVSSLVVQCADWDGVGVSQWDRPGVRPWEAATRIKCCCWCLDVLTVGSVSAGLEARMAQE